jgi:DNA-binding transcriptional LysR family regulator
MLDWNDLRFALAVARSGSLSSAASALGVHQTTCGRRLGALEEALGFPLFLRTPSGMVATSEGEQVLSSLEDLAGSLTRFEQGMRVGRSGVRGLVRVATTETSARQLVGDAIPELAAKHPELSIELVTGNAPVDLGKGAAEMAVRLTAPDEGLVCRRLGVIRHGLYASDAYLRKHRAPVVEGLMGHSVISPSRELARGPDATWIAEHARDARKVFFSSSLITCALAVAQGVGLCPLPTTVAALHDLRIVRMLDEIAPQPIWLVMHPDVRKIPRVRVVADVVASCVKRHARAALELG